MAPSHLNLRRVASTPLMQQLIIVVAAAAMYFANLGAAGLWDLDEALYSSIAREMSANHDWVVPRYNAAVWCEKPPLMFWLMIGSFKVLGVSELAARLPAALLAIGTALATYYLARRLFSANVGFLAGMVVASNIIFTVSARAATVDSALTFLTTLVMALFASGIRWGDDCRVGQASAGPPSATYTPTSWKTYISIGVLLGLAILAKGPIGFLLPAASLGLFLLVMNAPVIAREQPDGPGGPSCESSSIWSRTWEIIRQTAAALSPRQVLRVTWSMRPLTVLSIAALVALPWFVLVALKTDGAWVEQFIKKYNARPFSQPFLGHSGPFYYHFLVVLVGLFPWSIFLGPTVVNTWQAIRSRGREMPAYLFVVCWIGVFFGFWSVCSTKLPHYVLPAYPALAILTACFLDAWLARSEAAPRYVMPTATGILLGVGVLMLAVLPWVTARYAPGEEIVALTGLGLAFGGGVAIYFLARDRRTAYLSTIAASAVLFIVTLFAWAALRIDRHQHSRPLLAAVRGDDSSLPRLAGYKYCDASTVYYAGGPVSAIYDIDALRRFVRESPSPYIITTGDGRADIETQMPGLWRVVARRPRFLAKGEIVVLTPHAAPAILSQRDRTTGQGTEETLRK
jgi:4-amino-4-deoxy-L-arabinose transferase-like glycosyltransferase